MDEPNRTPPSGKKARLFVALALPEGIRRELAAWRDQVLGGIEALRLVPEENLHLTLAFLGYLPEERIGEVGAALEGLPGTAPRLSLGQALAGVPSGSRPRLLAVDLEGEGVVELQEEVASRLELAGLYEREDRPFWPHLTLARVRPERRGSRRPARLPELHGALPAALTEQLFDAVRVAVYLSTLRRAGSSYASQAHIDLPLSRPTR